MLQFQKRMEETKQTSNLKSLFNVSSVPKDTCMREVLDKIDPDHVRPIFTDLFSKLQQGAYLEQYRVLKSLYYLRGRFQAILVPMPSTVLDAYEGKEKKHSLSATSSRQP